MSPAARRASVGARGAAASLLLLTVSGCAVAGQPQPQVQQVGEMLWQSYHATASLRSVDASVNMTVMSGVDALAGASGSYALWFAADAAQADMTLYGPSSPGKSPGKLYTVTDQGDFYSGTALSKLASGKQDLVETARLHPAQLPQIVSPGFDPFQLNVLLGSLQWPGTISSLGPVVVASSAGQRTEYQLRVRPAALAQHEPAVGKAWLNAMAKEPGGALITLDVSVNAGRISAVTARLPLPPAPMPAIKAGKGAGVPPGALKTPPPASVVITETFDYSAPVPAVSRPS
ncbi:MAG TPA: hypothetical protein VFO01_05040 [Trebonia sp.]|nr:hypothetical protein [Trebonia sp.]